MPEISLLDRGLTFIPMVSDFPLRLFTECHLRNIRNIKLRDFFQHSNRVYNYDPDEFKNRFTMPSTYGLLRFLVSPLLLGLRLNALTKVFLIFFHIASLVKRTSFLLIPRLVM